MKEKRFILPPNNHSGNQSIEKVVFSSDVKEIGNSCFCDCTNLKMLIFEKDSNIKVIRKNSFYKTALEVLYLPASLLGIGSNAFANCKKLKVISFAKQSKISLIFDGAFKGDTALEKVIFPKKVITIYGRKYDLSKPYKMQDLIYLLTIGKNKHMDRCLYVPKKRNQKGQTITTISPNSSKSGRHPTWYRGR